MKLEVVSFGDVVADINIAIPHLPVQANEHQTAHDMFVGPGGSCNFMIAGAQLGLTMHALGSIGDDIYGRQLISVLKRQRVDVSALHMVEGMRTTSVVVIIDEAGEHVFIGVLGAKGPETLPPSWREIISWTHAFFTSGWTHRLMWPQVVLDALHTARVNDVPVFFDVSPEVPSIDPDWLAEVLHRTTVLLLTQEEAEQMTGMGQAEEAGRALLARGPEMVVVKLGPGGCNIITATESVVCQAFPVKVRDTTGAGDAFDAACVYAHLVGYGLKEMGTFANAVGAAKVQKLGAGVNVPTADEVRAILQRFDVPVDF